MSQQVAEFARIQCVTTAADPEGRKEIVGAREHYRDVWRSVGPAHSHAGVGPQDLGNHGLALSQPDGWGYYLPGLRPLTGRDQVAMKRDDE